MSVTSSDLIAAAVLEAAAASSVDRRLVLADHLGIDLGKLHAALLSIATQELDLLDSFAIVLGKTAAELGHRSDYQFRAVVSGDALVVPYLVAPLSGRNSGSQGFAAALRSAFQVGARPDRRVRVLLTLDRSPVETVLTASENAAALPQLSWPALARRARAAVAQGPASGTLDALVHDVAKRRGDEALLDRLITFVSSPWASSDAMGSELQTLGIHLADPDIAADATNRMERGARWRSKLDGWATPGGDLDGRLAKQPSISAGAASKVSSSLGPSGLDYSMFTLADVEGTATTVGLRFASPLHVTGAPVVATRVNGDHVLAVWLPGGSGRFSVRLVGDLLGTESASAAWRGTSAEANIVGSELVVELQGSGWGSGTIEMQTSAGGSRLGVLAYFGEGSWFPVERALEIDTAAGAFVVSANEPEALAVGAVGQFLGSTRISVPQAVDDSTVVFATASLFGEDVTIPLLFAGRPGDREDVGQDDTNGESGDESPSEQPGEIDDDENENSDAPGGLVSLGLPPQASPVHARVDASRRRQTSDTGPVTFTAGTPILVGGSAYELASQNVGGRDGLALETFVLSASSVTAFAIGSEGPPEPLLELCLVAEGPLSREIQSFLDARASFFAVAGTRGTVLALGADLPRVEALAYCTAYSDLLAAVPRGERYRPLWDSILLTDTITDTVSGEVLVAPTNPHSVCFYLALAMAVEGWVTDQQLPSVDDIAALGLRHLLPMFHLSGLWFDSVATGTLLWRLYRPMYQAGSVSDHDPRLISNRLKFFLDVYPAYNDHRQRLAISFHDPGDGATVLKALRFFYWPDISKARMMRSGPPLTRPALDVTLVTDGEIPRAVRTLLEGVGDDLADRVIRERVRFRIVDANSSDPASFHHVTYLFRSRGERAPWPVEMSERAPTTYVGGLAAAPGRSTLSSGGESAFAWGSFAPYSCGDAGAGAAGDCLAAITRAALELVGGQPRELVQDGLTRMPTTVVRSQQGAPVYESSVWVVHLDRLLGLEAFTPAADQSLYIVDYSDSDDPSDPGLDAITVTGKVSPYHHALSVALADFGTLAPQGRNGILQVLNGVSGRWALQLLRQAPHQIRERVGTVTAIAVLRDIDRCFEPDDGVGVIVPLDEVWDAVERRASATARHPACDDLLYLHLARGFDGRLRVGARLIEVKFRTTGQPGLPEARAELETARIRLKSLFDVAGPARLFRGRDLAEVVRTGWTRGRAFGLHPGGNEGFLEEALGEVASGQYDLDMDYFVGSERLGGDVLSIEAESLAEVTRVVLPGAGTNLGLVRVGRRALDLVAAGLPLGRPRRWEAPTFGSDPSASSGGGDVGGQPDPGPPSPSGDAGTSGEETPTSATGSSATAGRTAEQSSRRTGTGDAEAERLAVDLTRAAAKYGLELEPFQPHLAQVGPSVIRFRARPLGRQSLAGVQRLALDLGREIGSGEGVIVDQEAYFITIDVPRAQRETVLYADYESLLAIPSAVGSLDFLVGMDPSGDVKVADLARLPHLLVAGATGSGKSVFVRGLVSALIKTRTPEQLRLMIVDPKQVDFLPFEDLPHLMLGGVITDPGEALMALSDTIDHERQYRLPILKQAGVTSVLEFYEAGHDVEELPQIVVVVDEFADLATSLDRENRAQFMGMIQRYGQITRAFGIYLVLATQRPSVNVITGDIKANLTARVALKVQASQDSVTILGRGGAERLRDRGDLIFDHGGNSERLQGFFATGDDARSAVSKWLHPR